MSDQTTVLACVPRSPESFVPVEGSQEENCADCGRPIWVSPASRIHAGENSIYCCLHCVSLRMKEDPNPEFAGISGAQIEELRAALSELGKRPT